MEVLPMVFSLIGPAMGLASKFIGGGSQSSAPAPAKIPATSTITGSAVAPGTSPTDFTKDQSAWWQNLFAGTGQGLPGGALPTDISSMIEKQAGLINQ